jgi:hypothetical protein
LRLLPLFGVFLFLLPLLWRTASGPGPNTVQSGVYLFGAWFILIAASFVLSRKLQTGGDRAPSEPAPDDPDSDAGGTV